MHIWKTSICTMAGEDSHTVILQFSSPLLCCVPVTPLFHPIPTVLLRSLQLPTVILLPYEIIESEHKQSMIRAR